MIKLSHSAVQRYVTCPREYFLHYIEKLRPTTLSSPLLFGNAIDKACEDYILNRNLSRARELFKRTWREQEHNDKVIDLQLCTEIDYLDSDADPELLFQSDNELILKDTIFTNVSDLLKDLKSGRELSPEDKQRLNYINWISMYRKGRYLVESFANWVDSNVEEVLSAQEQIELEDGDGDQVTGLADFVLKLLGHDKPIVIDLKTSGRYYDRNSVKDSDQLALYLFYLRSKYEGMEKAGYFVLHKTIKKNREKICSVCGYDGSGKNHKTCPNEIDGVRCNGAYNYRIFPEASTQYIVDEIQEEKIEQVLDTFNTVKAQIVEGNFPKNETACVRYNGKVTCPYKKYCESGCMDGLIDKKVLDKPNETKVQSIEQENDNGETVSK